MATVDTYKIKINVEGKDQIVDLNNSIDKLESRLTGFAQAGIAAFTALAASAVHMADQMTDVADSIGVTVDKIYNLNIALEASGGKFGEAGGLLKGFTNMLFDVSKGSQDTFDALDKIGLGVDELKKLSDEQLFNTAIKKLGEMEAGFERNKIGMQIFGKAADGINWTLMAQGIDKAADPRLAANMQLAGDAMGKLETAFRSFQRAALEAVAPILEIIKDIDITVEDARKALQIFGALIAAAFAASTVLGIIKVVEAVKKLSIALRAAGAAQAFLTGLTGVGLPLIAAAAVAATAAYVALGKAMEDVRDKAAGPQGGAPMTEPIAGIQATGPARKIGVSPEQAAVIAAKEQLSLMQQQNQQANEYQRTLIGNIGLEGNLSGLIQSNAQAEQDKNNKLADLQKQINIEKGKGSNANAGIIAQLQLQQQEVQKQYNIQVQLNQSKLDALNKERQLQLDITRNTAQQNRQVELDLIQQQITGMTAVTLEEKTILKLAELTAQEKRNAINLDAEMARAKQAQDQIAIADIEKRKQAETEYYANLRDLENKRMEQEINNRNNRELGIKQAMENISRNFDPIKVAADQTNLLFDRMGQGLEEFVKTGKLNFKSFALSLIRDMLLIQVRAQAMNWLKGMMGGGGLFGGTIIPGLLAEGGPATPGKPYIVGEKGPELFVPKSAGNVIPNKALNDTGRAMSAGAVSAPITNNYITNNVSALDAKSVAQLFAENRRTLFGTVEMARKEMPYAYGR